MREIVILGGGGHSKVLIETILACNNDIRIVLLDDKFTIDKSVEVLGFPIIGKLGKIYEFDFKEKYTNAVVAIGNSDLRIKWIKNIQENGYRVPSFIHPTAYISPSSSIESGTVVFAKAVVQSNVKIGKGAILNSNVIIEHDGIVGDGSHICPGVSIAGNVKVGNSSWIGIGSTIKENLNIGSNVTIGAGSVVIENIGDNSLAYGVPARIKKQ